MDYKYKTYIKDKLETIDELRHKLALKEQMIESLRAKYHQAIQKCEYFEALAATQALKQKELEDELTQEKDKFKNMRCNCHCQRGLPLPGRCYVRGHWRWNRRHRVPEVDG